MDNQPTPPATHNSAAPEPEVLKPREEAVTASSGAKPATHTPTAGSGKRLRRTYRPSHKATFIGLAVVVLILGINAAIIAVVLKGKNNTNQPSGQVTINADALNKVGLNTSTLGDSGIVLTVDPNTQFNGKMTVAGNVTIGGQLNLNSKFSASDASFTQLEAGNTSLSQLDVNGNTSLSSLSLRNNLAVAGTTQLQGAVTVSQLLTVNNNLTVSGSLSVGGVLSTKTFSASSLTSTGTLTIGGHVITNGSAPSVGPGGGSALGSNGTVSISGNDAAGSISVNIGTGATDGTLANVAFHSDYTGVPRVIISPVGQISCPIDVINRSASGFSIWAACGLSPGGYSVDYIVEQ